MERYQLHCFIRCLLVTLSTLATVEVKEDGSDRSTSVDLTALEVTDMVFNEIAKNDQVTFDDFADWYTNVGHHVIPWLELLDLDKWFQGRDRSVAAEQTRAAVANSPAKVEERQRAREQEEQYRSYRADSSDSPMPPNLIGRSRKQSFLNEEEAEESRDQPPLFEFVLSPTSGSKLSVYPKDVEMIVDTVRLACLQQSSVEDIWGMFGVARQDDTTKTMTLEQFQHSLYNMFRKGGHAGVFLEEDEFEFVSAVLSGVFHSIEAGGEINCNSDSLDPPCVRVDELIGSFSVFVGIGSKSEKLAAIFDTFDNDCDGLINRATLKRYIRCVLSSLGHLTMVVPGIGQFDTLLKADDEGVDSSDSTFNRVVRQVCHDVVDDIWKYRNILYPEGKDMDDMISFETFASWYTHGGYEMAAWLELLDHKKWLRMGNQAATSPSSNIQEQDEEEEDTDNKVTPRDYAIPSRRQSIYDPLFEFPIDSSHRIIICRQDCQILNYLLWICKLNEVKPIEAVSAMSKILSNKGYSGAVNEEDFFSFVNLLCPSSRMSKKETERTFFNSTMKQFYDSFSMADIDTVVGDRRLVQAKSAMLCSGMMLFCNGPKSQKLAMSFDMFVVPGEKDVVDKEMFSLFLLSFMIMISSLTLHGQSLDTGVLHLAARGLARLVYDAVGPTRYITFQDFADWYTAEGHEVVPWLELLDINKWPKDGSNNNDDIAEVKKSLDGWDMEEEEEESRELMKNNQVNSY